MTTAARRALTIFLLNLLFFLSARVGLWLIYQDDFVSLTPLELTQAFLDGEWFDLSVIAMVSGFPLLMMLLPFHWASHSSWLGWWTWISYGLLMMLGLLLAADIIYFSFVHRHVGPEIKTLGADPVLLVDMMFGSYAWAVAVYVMVCLLLYVLWRRLFPARTATIARGIPRVAIFLVAIVGVALLARGGLGKKPIDVVDAFRGDNPAAAYLALNGPFAMGRSMLNARPMRSEFFPWPEAVSRTRQMVLATGEQGAAGDAYPLVRARTGAAPTAHPNIVVMMLESWDAAHVDVLRRHAGLGTLGVTPNFDALSREGVLFTRFYANGERSMDGLAALLAGIPTLPGTAYLGMGMEQNRMAYLGRMGQQEGYDTFFLQSSLRQSFHVDSIAAMSGFKTYLGAEDIPASGHSPRITERGAWDHDMLQEANRRFASAHQPFLGFLFTASTHMPFQSPGERWQKFPPDSLEHRFLNSLFYADWALGEFIKSAKAAGYYDNTIFVLTADHISGFAGRSGDTPSLHHVPLLVIAPGLKPGVIHQTGGQVDVIPTLAQLAGWKAAHAGLGRSLLDRSSREPRGTLTVRGNVIERIEDAGWVVHDLEKRIATSPNSPEAAATAMESRLLAMYQVAHTLLMQNRVYPPEQHRSSRAQSR